MIKFVNAKINLGLNIVRKRDDGYHELETLFYPVGVFNGTPENPEPFCDILEVHFRDSGRGDEFSFWGNPIDCPLDKNLVVKAVRGFKAFIDINYPTLPHIPDVELSLYKRIPDGAGLGGGSADASFTLLALNELNKGLLSKAELIKIAATIGADCPFFIENHPVLATGIGEVMTPFPLDLSGYWAVIVKPDVYISTKEAFSSVTPRKPETSISDILRLPIDQWESNGLKNDFEKPIFHLYPVLSDIKQRLYSNGALYSAMSGSGSSIFGIFPSRDSAAVVRNSLGGFLIKL